MKRISRNWMGEFRLNSCPSRDLAEWWGHAISLDFRFFQPAEIADALESAGLPVEMSLERVNYPQEIETRRAYVLARNQQ